MPRKYRPPGPGSDAVEEQQVRARVLENAEACAVLLYRLQQYHPEHERPAGRTRPAADDPHRKPERNEWS
jgi:hypothetical protein